MNNESVETAQWLPWEQRQNAEVSSNDNHNAEMFLRLLEWGISPSSCLSLNRGSLPTLLTWDAMLPSSLPRSCDSPALWSIPDEELMMGLDVKDCGTVPAGVFSAIKASLENRWLYDCQKAPPATERHRYWLQKCSCNQREMGFFCCCFYQYSLLKYQFK